MQDQQQLRVIISQTTDPFWNLALEDWIFKELEIHQKILFLWRNDPCVVVGRFQNPWLECDLKKMKDDGVPLVRRQSGGGTVYHDHGNMNFTFLGEKKSFDKSKNNIIITRALSRFGIAAKTSGRNDIVIEDSEGVKKISGSAFKEKKDRAFHHGTLLIDANLDKLIAYLNPRKKNFEAKGIPSVRSLVANLFERNSDINYKNLTQAIIEEFFAFYGEKCEVEALNPISFLQKNDLAFYRDFLRDDQWRYGETPKFTHFMAKQFEWGKVAIEIRVEKGRIVGMVLEGDAFHPEIASEMAQLFQGQSYWRCDVQAVRSEITSKYSFLLSELNQLLRWLEQEVR